MESTRNDSWRLGNMQAKGLGDKQAKGFGNKQAKDWLTDSTDWTLNVTMDPGLQNPTPPQLQTSIQLI